MKSNFTAEFFRGNRERLKALFMGTAPIVITANGLLQRNNDVPFPFHQDSTFWYLTGIDEPDVILVMDKDKEYLILPEGSDYLSVFAGDVDSERLQNRSGIATVLSAKEGWKTLSGRLKRVQHVATISPAARYIADYGMYTNPARERLIERLKANKPELELLDLRQHLAKLRVIKQPQELVAIEQAVDLTIGALRQAKRRLAIGRYDSEYQVAADIHHYFISKGYDNAWQPNVMAGANATILHNDSLTGPIKRRDFVLLDIGAEVEHYAADISRTYARGKKPTKRQQDVHAAVLAVQDYAFSLCKPGASIKDNEQHVEQFMGEKLRELGLIKSIEREQVRKYFSHATSHYLGLDAHDAGDYDQPLKPGMVLTVEPGIYIPEEGIGVRIEDDILITEDGHRNLTASLSNEW